MKPCLGGEKAGGGVGEGAASLTPWVRTFSKLHLEDKREALRNPGGTLAVLHVKGPRVLPTTLSATISPICRLQQGVAGLWQTPL